VRKAARFCNKCGSPAPGGWWKCPQCKKWVGAEANFCWSCKAPLHPESRADIAGGMWQRQPGAFAVRVRVAEMRRLLERGLEIEIGTVALLVEDGLIKAVLDPGRHTLETVGRKLLGLFTPPALQTVILVEAGDVVLPLRFSDLRTREELKVECYTEVCFRFVPSRGEAFLANVLKAQDSLSYEGLADWMRQEIRGALADGVQVSSIEELVKDPQRRLRIEDSLRKSLAVALERAGVELVRVASAEFTGPEYEALRERAGQVEVKRREIEFQMRMRELTTTDEMNRLKTESELEAYVRQLAKRRKLPPSFRSTNWRGSSRCTGTSWRRWKRPIKWPSRWNRLPMKSKSNSSGTATPATNFSKTPSCRNESNRSSRARKCGRQANG
jgi:hypothetical protein